MASQEDHVAMFRTFIRANGNSENVCNLYWKRVRTFLSKHPEAMELDKDALKGLVDDYISTIPITSGIEVTATAVRYYWTMRFGERWCKRFDPTDYAPNDAIEEECSEFASYLKSLGYLSAQTIHDRTHKVRRFLYVMFGDGFDRGRVCLASVMAYLSEDMSGLAASTRRGFCTEVRSYAKFLVSEGCAETAGPISRMRLTGAALEDYALNGRPEAGSRALFLPCGREANGERMTFGQVGGAMELVSQKAGVAFRGTHSLRRAVASGMVNGGAPIKFVADVLGHESVMTTMAYLRIDSERLRLAASTRPAEVMP